MKAVMAWMCAASALVLAAETPTAPVPTFNVADAVREVKRTQRPVFAVAYSDSCPVCRGLLNTLEKEPSLQPIAAQFVNVRINVESPEFRTWERQYPRPSSAIPGVYVVAASGKAIDLRAGGQSVEDLQTMLTAGLKQAGRLPRPDQLKKLHEAAEMAKPAVASGDFATARSAFAPVEPELAQLYDGLILTPEGRAIREVVDAIAAEGEQRLKESLASKADGWATAWAIASVSGDFDEFPGLTDEIDAAEAAFAEDAAQKVMLRQARELYRAKQSYGADRSERGRKALERIVVKYGGTPAAQTAAEILAGRETEKPADVAGAYRTWRDRTGKFSIDARYDGARGGKVRLERRDGKLIEVPLAKLSDADRQFIEAQAAAF